MRLSTRAAERQALARGTKPRRSEIARAVSATSAADPVELRAHPLGRPGDADRRDRQAAMVEDRRGAAGERRLELAAVDGIAARPDLGDLAVERGGAGDGLRRCSASSAMRPSSTRRSDSCHRREEGLAERARMHRPVRAEARADGHRLRPLLAIEEDHAVGIENGEIDRLAGHLQEERAEAPARPA